VRGALLACGLLAAAAGPAFADDGAAGSLADRLALSGSVRGAYWTSARDLDDQRNLTPAALWLKATPDLGDGFGGRVDGWVGDERILSGAGATGELREALVSWRGGEWDASVGRRIVVWGRADKVNPTDVIGSRDYTLLVPEDDDQRRGSTMATLARTFGDYTATAYWLPEFRPNIVPIEKLPGFSVRQGDARVDAAQGAIRLDHTGRGFDWALSYFDGLDRDPDARIDSLSSTGVSVEARHRRARVFGADFATNLDKVGLRGEVAYHDEAARDPADAFDKGDYVSSAIGLDRNVGDDVNINVQYLFHYVTDYVDPSGIASPVVSLVAQKGALINNQLRRTQHGATARAAYTGLNDTLTVELSSIAWVTDGSWALRPKAAYAISDQLKAIAGIDMFFGDGDSFFGNLRKNRTAYLELRYGF
jgi:hypothetical protein